MWEILGEKKVMCGDVLELRGGKKSRATRSSLLINEPRSKLGSNPRLELNGLYYMVRATRLELHG